VDLAEPGAMKYIDRRETEIFQRLEETDPGDPGVLSCAVLRIAEGGEDMVLSAEIGDTLQKDGNRIPQLLGFLQGPSVDAMASTDLNVEGVLSFAMPAIQNPRLQGAELLLFCGQGPALYLRLGNFCLGVLPGPELVRFWDCLRRRCSLLETKAA
jgi:hypothetical protein